MVVFDTSILAIAFDPKAKVPSDPQTGKPVSKCKERIDFLLSGLGKTKQRVLIPTPVLAEYLVMGGLDKDKRLLEFTNSKVFSIAPFDTRAAVECAEIEDGAGNSKPLSETETKAKVKFDRQIIAIAKAAGAKTIFTGDGGLAKCAQKNNLNVVMTWDLPLPPEPPELPQMDLLYEEAGIFGTTETEQE